MIINGLRPRRKTSKKGGKEMKKGFFPAVVLLFCISISPAWSEPVQQAADAGVPVYSLNDLYVLGLERAEKIKISEEDLYISERGRDKARAAFLPSASLFGSYTRYDNSSSAGSENDRRLQSSANWGARLDESLSLSGREFTAYAIAKENIDKSRFDFSVVKEDYLFSIAAAYYDVLKAKKALDIAQANVQRLTKQRDAASVRLRVGEVTKTAVLRAEAELSGAQSDEIRSGNGLSVAKVSLARIVGINGEYEIREDASAGLEASPAGGETMVAGCPLPAADCLKQQALAERTELKNLDLQKKIAGEQVRFARGSFWPTLSFEAVYTGREDDPSSSSDRDSIYGGLKLNFPFYEGGLRKAEVLEAEAKLRQAGLQLEDRKKAILLEVDSAFFDFITQKGIIEKFASQVAYARDNFQAVSKQFEFGLANSLDVMDANTVLVTAERQLADARFSYQLAGLRLKRVTGTFLKTALNQ